MKELKLNSDKDIIERILIYLTFRDSARILWDKFNEDSQRNDYFINLSLLRVSQYLRHVAIENLIKSGLNKYPEEHDLLELNKQFEKQIGKKSPIEIKRALREINPYGSPANQSFRYTVEGQVSHGDYSEINWEYFLINDKQREIYDNSAVNSDKKAAR